MQEVMLRVTGTQKRFDEEPDVIELITPGKIYEKEGYVYIVYKDEGLTGAEEKITTTVKAGPDSVRILKYREDKSQAGHLDFFKGEENRGLYLTPFGEIDVVIRTKEIENRLSALEGGQLKIHYYMTIMGMIEAEMAIDIEIIGGNGNGKKGC